jgi:hypothetical protein
MKPLIKKSRQANTTQFLILFLALFWTSTLSYGQNNPVDYRAKSIILHPDTIRDRDMKKVFWHFVDYSYEEIKNLETDFIKSEFEKLGITTDDRTRFVSAFIFFDTTMKNHKRSCEQWREFEDLKP